MTVISAATSNELGSRPDTDLAGSGGQLFISVVVPIRNEEAFIADTLNSLLRQDYPEERFEIVVVDGESSDRTCEIVAEIANQHSHVRLFQNPKRFSSAARNIAIRESRGEVIAVVDGHCEIDNACFLRELNAAFVRSGADCIGRPAVFEVTGASTLQLAIAAARASRLGHHPDSYIYSNQEGFVPAHSLGAMYRRSVFERIGMFDESFDACEDVEFNHRVDCAGLRCLLAPRITLRYHPRASLLGLFRQLARYGRGRVRLLRKHPDTLSLKSLLPGLFVVGIVLGAIGSVFSPTLAVVYAAGIGIYLAVVLLFSFAIAARRRNPRLVFWLPGTFLAIHVGAGWGIVYEFLLGRKTRVEDTPSYSRKSEARRQQDGD